MSARVLSTPCAGPRAPAARPPRRTEAAPRARFAAATRRPRVVAAAAEPEQPPAEGGAGGGGFSLGGLFGKKDKEVAARQALQAAFQGVRDPFAADEKRRLERGGDGGAGGGGGGSGGGGGGGFGGFDLGGAGDSIMKWLRATARALAAALLFLGFILLFTLWQPALALGSRLIRAVLRLDSSPRVATAAAAAASAAPDFSKTEGVGNVEAAVTQKWAGPDLDDETDGSEYDDE
jgi:hypothetical protein